jgi:choline dehydrogenase-like flavoprotein
MFIAGTSVMPSSSCVNPTLTGAALSVRIADTLIKEI